MCMLAFSVRHAVPRSVHTIKEVRKWIAHCLNFPVEEACLIREGVQLKGEEEVGEEDMHLVTQPPALQGDKEDRTGRIGEKKVVIYVEDTTRRKKRSKTTGELMSKMYAVKMLPHQTIRDLRIKLWTKSSCRIPPTRQVFTVRGRRVQDYFSLREYLITQRVTRLVFFLTDRGKGGGEGHS